jgi:hypothetical protein
MASLRKPFFSPSNQKKSYKLRWLAAIRETILAVQPEKIIDDIM